MKKTIVLLFFLCLVFLIGCNQNALQKVINEEIVYFTYNSDGFSIKYPSWPLMNDGAGPTGAEVSVSKGYCTVMVNTESIGADFWYLQLIKALEQGNSTILSVDNSSLKVVLSMMYPPHKLISEVKVFDCNQKAHMVNIACIEQVYGNVSLHKEIFGSAVCKDSGLSDNNKNGKAQEKIIKEKETTYKELVDQDFSLTYPEWTHLQDNATERVIGVSAGTCTLIVNKHNARPGDLSKWLDISLAKNKSTKILSSFGSGGKYKLVYTSPYFDKILRTDARVDYCNYLSYFTAFVCIDGTNDSVQEAVRSTVLESIDCAKHYVVPEMIKVDDVVKKVTQEKELKKEIPKKKVEEIKKEVEEIKEKIVYTTIGDRFGIDEEAVVYMVNNNVFFTKVLSDFSKGNLVFEDKETGDVKLKIKFDASGKLTYLGDGSYDDADVTLYVPLKTALNIVNNIDKLNPLTLLSFAVSVRTEPANVKQNVISKALKGGYK